MTATVTFVGHFPKGVTPSTYRPTAIDEEKRAADFLLVDIGKKSTIQWRDGRSERVTDRQLTKLQALHAWATDF